jgi:hypothetical protein
MNCVLKRLVVLKDFLEVLLFLKSLTFHAPLSWVDLENSVRTVRLYLLYSYTFRKQTSEHYAFKDSQ